MFISSFSKVQISVRCFTEWGSAQVLSALQERVGTPTCLHLFYPVLRFTSQLSFLCPKTQQVYRMAFFSASRHRPVRPITEWSNTQRLLYKEGNQDRRFIHTFIPSYTHRTLQAVDTSRRNNARLLSLEYCSCISPQPYGMPTRGSNENWAVRVLLSKTMWACARTDHL
jgi:hypothetical protein